MGKAFEIFRQLAQHKHSGVPPQPPAPVAERSATAVSLPPADTPGGAIGREAASLKVAEAAAAMNQLGARRTVCHAVCG